MIFHHVGHCGIVPFAIRIPVTMRPRLSPRHGPDDTLTAAIVAKSEVINKRPASTGRNVMRGTLGFGLALAVVFVAVRPSASAAVEPRPEKYLINGRLVDAEKDLGERLQKSPQDDNVRFALGAARFLRGLERLGQSLYRYGLRDQAFLGQFVPIVRLPFSGNPHPETLSYEKSRAIVQAWIADFDKTETTLAPIADPAVALPVELNLVRLDIAGDGTRMISVVEIVTRLMNREQGQRQILVRFDRADVAWLRGYCHLLEAIGEVLLAHDGRELFEHTGQVFFTKIETPYKFLLAKPSGENEFWANIPDMIAVIHLLRLPVIEPARMQAALAHLQQMLAMSREMWKFVLAETDDDHEWIPNPKQKSVVGITVTQQMVDGWLGFLDEADALLAGKRLIPFWRTSETKGVNLRRVFTQPRTFDAVLWFQGTAAVPYFEDGPKTRPEVWDRLLRAFEGDLFLLAAWFN
jgi:hypothetical protein